MSGGGSTARSACRTRWERLQAAGNVANLELAAAAESGHPVEDGTYVNDLPFLDSDLYKWLEAIGWTLADPELTSRPPPSCASGCPPSSPCSVGAQAEDGYLDSHFQVRFPGERFVQLPWGHELYCAGPPHPGRRRGPPGDRRARAARRRSPVRRPHHVLLRHRRGSGRRRLRPPRDRDRAGRAPPGDRRGELPGHRAVLHRPPRPRSARRRPVRRATTSKITSRSARPRRSTGHSVRQLYLLAGVADLATQTGEPALREAAERLWAQWHRHPDLPDRRDRCPPHRRGVRRPVRAAERAQLLRDLRGHRVDHVLPADAAAHR